MPLRGHAQVYLKDKSLKAEALGEKLSIFNIITDMAKKPSKKASSSYSLQSPFKMKILSLPFTSV